MNQPNGINARGFWGCPGDYAVRKPDSERASAVLPTQGKAIDWAKERGGDVFVERVRNTDRGHPDKWRRP